MTRVGWTRGASAPATHLGKPFHGEFREFVEASDVSHIQTPLYREHANPRKRAEVHDVVAAVEHHCGYFRERCQVNHVVTLDKRQAIKPRKLRQDRHLGAVATASKPTETGCGVSNTRRRTQGR